MDKANKLYFLWGEEAFLIDKKISEIYGHIQQECGEEVELVYLDADELNPQQLLEELEFSPLFTWYRIVVIRRPFWLNKSQRKNSNYEGVLKVLQQYIERENTGQTLIITASEHNKSNPLVKLLDKEAVSQEYKHADAQYLISWVKDEFTAQGRTITSPALGMLAKSGQDMYYLSNLIKKVLLTYPNGTITEKEIEDLNITRDEIKVFKLINSLMERKIKLSLDAFYQLLDQGEHPIYILHMIVRQFISLGKIKCYQESGTDSQEICRLTGMRDFAVKKLLNQARIFSWDEIRVLFEQFLQADIKFKSSSQDEKIIIETLIIQICANK
ncbi:MAG: DNA polymerase III subunit delta [Syntrophomonadaceae bacterium]|jgi:DNA polymerase-3 subunit delta